MRRSISLLATVAALAACDGDDTIVPADRMVAVGTYGYEAEWLHPVTQEWETLAGELVLDVVTPDSVHGRWSLPGYGVDSTGGFWNENAYVLEAVASGRSVTVTHRIWRFGAPSEVLCTLTFSEVRPNVEEPFTTSGTCDLVH